MNTFTAHGRIVEICDPFVNREKGFAIQRVFVDLTDGTDMKQNIVPFSINALRRRLPKALKIGDIVDIQFRLSSYEYGNNPRMKAAQLKIGFVHILGEAAAKPEAPTAPQQEAPEVQEAPQEYDLEKDVEEMVDHLHRANEARKARRIARAERRAHESR